MFKSWQVEQGLPQSSVQAIAQTPDGYMWFGTHGGLVRFDGVRLTVFDQQTNPELVDAYIVSLLVDRTGALWIGTAAGVVIYRNGTFTPARDEALTRRSIMAFAEDPSGAMWVATNGEGLTRVDGNRTRVFSRELSSPDVFAVRALRGDVWVGTGKGLDRIRGDQFQHFGDEIDAAVFAIWPMPDGRLLVGTSRGLYAFDGSHFLPTDSRFAEEVVWAITGDRDGNIWVGGRHGLTRMRGGNLSTLRPGDGLSNDYVDSLFEDREGNLWVGSHLGGINQLRNSRFVVYTTRDGLSHDIISSVHEDRDGSMWVATDGGLDRFAGGQWSHVPLSPPPKVSVSVVLSDGGGGAWAGTSGAGLYHVSNGRTVVYRSRDGLPSDSITALLRDRDGGIWIGTFEGLCRFENGRFTSFNTADEVRTSYILFISEDRAGRVWVGTSGGPLLWDGQRFVTRIGRTNLPGGSIYSMLDSRGDIWFGAHRGLYRLRGDRLTLLTANHGLVPGDVSHVFEIHDGSIWLTSNKGVYRVDRRELDAVANGTASRLSIALLGMSDGMRSAESSFGVSPSVSVSRSGRVWFPTLRGLAVLDPSAVRDPRLVSPIIEELIVDSKAHALSDDLVLGPGTEKLEFHYTTPNFTAPERVRFRYRLEGLDDGWVDVGTRRVAYYTNVPPGSYRFRVEAASSDGRWIPAMRTFDFRQLPQFYRTTWFIALCAAALLIAMRLAYAYRMRQLDLRHRAVLAERARIAREFHDTVAQDLAGLSLQLEILFQMVPAGAEDLKAQITAAKQVTHRSLVESRRALFELRSELMDGNDLVSAITHSADEITTGSPVRPTVRVVGTARRMSEEVETQLLRITQEATANAVRHASASKVDIVLEFGRNRVRLVVCDDGRGSGAHKLEDFAAMHYGLVGMRERAQQIGGRLTTKSAPGEGTQISVDVSA